MRVLFLNYEYPPIGGGGANATSYLFREYASIPDLNVDCVTSAWGGADDIEMVAENIRLFRLDVGKQDLHFWTQKEVLTWLLRSYGQVRKLMKVNSYDVCHAFFGFPSGMVAWLQRKNVPYLVSLRGSDVPGFNPRFTKQYAILKPIFRKIWSDAGRVTANSQGLQRLASQFIPSLDIDVIPNGIDSNEFSVVDQSEKVSGRILCVSRLVERKGVQDMIAAMPTILKKVPGAHLVVAGEGELLERLKRQCRELDIADKIELKGYVAHDELAQLYCSSELFVQPSFFEGMSNTVLEAMASGLPIVATGEGGREELLGDNAVMAPYNNPSALAEVIVGAMADKQKMNEMGIVSRQIAEQYSWTSVARDYLDIYQAMTATRHAPRATRHGL